ncbi:2-oxoglutarate and iron-dependent oxygenase domain-containing protein 3-like [Bacillus rossius redtenbacheri]|uniref:2-oxoglutarate and iron-dependent oxygenase domain-containing protein 3-like n=1 Tax=Bacillus rossius redtenbacheri TaxID=93214 RepID=UPI002FDE3EBA
MNSDAHRRNVGKVSSETGKKYEVQSDEEIKEKPIKYGPIPSFPYQRVWARAVLILGAIVVVYWTSQGGDVVLARQKDFLEQRAQEVPCSEEYKKEIEKFPDCVPERCGRMVTDKLVSTHEVGILLRIAEQGIGLGGSEGGASILDLHSGALSQGKNFVNIYKLDTVKDLFKPADFLTYRILKLKLQHKVAQHFGLKASALHLTHPTFFSRLTSAPAQTVHDEYWHPHVDKETYESFHYTCLVYLSDFGHDFKGGRFVYMDTDRNTTVEPRRGRVSMFTSGWENRHLVEQVTEGTRYAITVSFTCDKSRAIADPALPGKK